jgi:hypothetical protein
MFSSISSCVGLLKDDDLGGKVNCAICGSNKFRGNNCAACGVPVIIDEAKQREMIAAVADWAATVPLVGYSAPRDFSELDRLDDEDLMALAFESETDDPALYEECLTRAVALGNPDAMCFLAMLVKEERPLYAVRLQIRAFLVREDESSFSTRGLAIQLLETDLDEGRELLSEAMELEKVSPNLMVEVVSKSEEPEAKWVIGRSLLGEHHEAGMELILQAANEGNVQAMLLIARTLESSDIEKAILIYESLAAENIDYAIARLQALR